MPRATTSSVIGSGRLARSLLPLLRDAGYPVRWVYGRRRSHALSAARLARGSNATVSLARALSDTSLVLLAVSDAALEEVAGRIAALDLDWSRRTFLHHSGARGLDCLRPLQRVGASVGLLHPMQALGTPRLAARLIPGSAARIDGDRRGRAAALRLARRLGLRPLPLGELSDEQRLAYHTAASLVSNDVVALVDLALESIAECGLSREAGRDALMALVRGTLMQIERGGPEAALSGPAARGDTTTLRRQLQFLHSRGAMSHEIHRLLSERMARLAARHGEAGARRTLRFLAGRRKGRAV